MKKTNYIKIVVISVFVLGLLGFTSCRSMRSSCGLAEQTNTMPVTTVDAAVASLLT